MAELIETSVDGHVALCRLNRPEARNAVNGAVAAITFSPDGQTLASGSTDGTARLWSMTTRLTVAALTVYDMVKALGHGVVLKRARLLAKSGGKRDYRARKR